MVNATDMHTFHKDNLDFFAGRRHCERSLLMQPYSYWGGDTCPPRSAPSRLLSRLLCRLDCLLSISLIHRVTDDSDVISVPAGFRRHLVGKTLRSVLCCDIAEIRFVGQLVILETLS